MLEAVVLVAVFCVSGALVVNEDEIGGREMRGWD
jgi:hypothetical protein